MEGQIFKMDNDDDSDYDYLLWIKNEYFERDRLEEIWREFNDESKEEDCDISMVGKEFVKYLNIHYRIEVKDAQIIDAETIYWP